MKRAALILVLALGLSWPVFGQGWSMTAWFQQTIAVQAARLDLVAQHQSDPPLRGYLDVVWTQQNQQTYESELRVLGWAFQCGSLDLYAVDVRLNGFVKDATALVTRYGRGDVMSNQGLAEWCPHFIPLYSGIDLTVPLGQLLPGQYGVRLRLWSNEGASWTTNTVWVQVS